MKFFKPSWKKLILPLILIILYLVVINYLNSASKITDEYLCRFTELREKTIKFQEELNPSLNQTAREFIQTAQEWQAEIPKKNNAFLLLGKIMDKINPIFPVPCTMSEDDGYCKYYVSKDTYDCYVKQENFLALKPRPYKKINIFHHTAALIFLFLEGYIVSCLAFFIYKKIKKPQKPF
jgi:hypothetical protein